VQLIKNIANLTIVTVLLATGCRSTPSITGNPPKPTNSVSGVVSDSNSDDRIAAPREKPESSGTNTNVQEIPLAAFITNRVVLGLDIEATNTGTHKKIPVPVEIQAKASSSNDTIKLPVALTFFTTNREGAPVALGVDIEATNTRPHENISVPVEIQAKSSTSNDLIKVPITLTSNGQTNVTVNLQLNFLPVTNSLISVRTVAGNQDVIGTGENEQNWQWHTLGLFSIVIVAGIFGGCLRMLTFPPPADRTSVVSAPPTPCENSPISTLIKQCLTRENLGAIGWGMAAALIVPAYLDMTDRIRPEKLQTSGYILCLFGYCALAATFGAEFIIKAIKVFHRVHVAGEKPVPPPPGQNPVNFPKPEGPG